MTGTRDRFVASTLELFRVQGYNGTSLSQVTKAAGAPTGSLYHHFKGGKDELTIAVLQTAGAAYGDLLVSIWDAEPDPTTAVSTLFEGAAAVLEETDFIDPCPIGTIAREVASTNEGLRSTALGVFESWVSLVHERLTEAGLAETEAHELATALVASIEGGFILARTARDADLLRSVGKQMATSVADALSRAAESATTT